MKKSEMIEALAANTGVSKADCEKVFNATFALVEKELAAGEDVAVAGFGTFKVAKREAREGRNPSTGETIHIAACKAVTFKVASHLKEVVNK